MEKHGVFLRLFGAVCGVFRVLIVYLLTDSKEKTQNAILGALVTFTTAGVLVVYLIALLL